MFTKSNHISLVIPRNALEVVFDECDRYDEDETGGRVIGTYKTDASHLTVTVTGIIEPGPKTARTATYLKQDGAYQERVFREIEKREPSIEHLGNWHTHHVNSLRHLSGGDIETYRRTVEHKNHNTDFFYALLVTEKRRDVGQQRYDFKNYVFRRGDENVYEIPNNAVHITDSPLDWPALENISPQKRGNQIEVDGPEVKKVRVYDRDIIAEFFPNMKIFTSKELGIYWRGTLSLVNGFELHIVVLEDTSAGLPRYTVTLRDPPALLERFIKQIAKEDFSSCRAALIATERLCNLELYDKREKGKRSKLWTF